MDKPWVIECSWRAIYETSWGPWGTWKRYTSEKSRDQAFFTLQRKGYRFCRFRRPDKVEVDF